MGKMGPNAQRALEIIRYVITGASDYLLVSAPDNFLLLVLSALKIKWIRPLGWHPERGISSIPKQLLDRADTVFIILMDATKEKRALAIVPGHIMKKICESHGKLRKGRYSLTPSKARACLSAYYNQLESIAPEFRGITVDDSHIGSDVD